MSVHLLTTGGTIASHERDGRWDEVDGPTLAEELGVAAEGVVVTEIGRGPSADLAVADMVAVAREVEGCLLRGADGVVVAHGTDTMELTAFVTELLLGVDADRAPVVFTGAMRAHSHPAPDGPANLVAALALARHRAARGREVMVCMDGVVHAAAAVTKRDARSLDAFTSAPLAPVGSVAGEVRLEAPRPTPRRAAAGLGIEVPLVVCSPATTAADVAAAVAGRRAAVLEVVGDLHVPRRLWRTVHEAWEAGVLCVVASMSFTDRTVDDDLHRLGAVGAGGLTARKAQLATMAALTTCADRDAAVAFLHQHRLTHDAQERSTR